MDDCKDEYKKEGIIYCSCCGQPTCKVNLASQYFSKKEENQNQHTNNLVHTIEKRIKETKHLKKQQQIDAWFP